MKLGLLCVEMVIIMFLGNIESDFPDDLPSSCPIFDRYRIEMPIECPFHPHRDVLWWPEDNLSAFIFTDDSQGGIKSVPSTPATFSVTSITEKITSFFTSIWRCPLCSKMFDCSERLANHWDIEHRLYRHRTENFVCLSDFCDFMRCDVLNHRRIYPTIGKSKYLARMISSTLSVNPANLPPPQPFSGAQNCNQTEMDQLEKRCRIVVRQCILPLLISKITMKDFRDMEEDMVKETCGYLNCDKFFDLTVHEEGVRPLSFCLLMGIVMIGGFLICYYIVWTLFESTLGIKQSQLEQIRKARQLKGKESPSPTSSTPTVTSPGTPLPASSRSGSVARKQSGHDQGLLCRQCKYTSRRSGESETSQEDASPASSESRYIVTHPGNRRYQRPSHLYLASELALLLEKRSMETVPESSDDQGSMSLVSQSPPPPLHPPSQSLRPSLSFQLDRPPSLIGSRQSSAGLTRSNVAIVAQQQQRDYHDESQTSQGSQESRRSKNSSQSTSSIKEMVAPMASTSKAKDSTKINYHPNKRRDFAMRGRRSRYDGDDYTYDEDDTDELIATVTTPITTSTAIKSPLPSTSINIRPTYGGTKSDMEDNRYHSEYSDRSTDWVRSGREIRFSRETEPRKCEAGLDHLMRKSQSLQRTSRIVGRRERGISRNSSDTSDTVNRTTGQEIESEPVVSAISGRRFSRPGMVRSISSSGAVKRAAMVSNRYSSQPIAEPVPSTSTKKATFIPSGTINRSRYPFSKSQSIDDSVYNQSSTAHEKPFNR